MAVNYKVTHPTKQHHQKTITTSTILSMAHILAILPTIYASMIAMVSTKPADSSKYFKC